MATNDSMIQVKNLKKHYHRGAIKALDDVTVNINKGDVMVVIGPSGSGKSTFLRSLNLLEEPTDGEIIFNGVDITKKRYKDASGKKVKLDIDALRQKMGMVFQHFNLFPHMTILDNMTLAPMKLLGRPKDEAETEALKASVSEYKDKWIRSVAEFDNYKKRTAKCESKAYKDGKSEMLKKVFFIGDSLDWALAMELDEKTADGIRQLRKKFASFLEGEGVTEIDPVGEVFDPHVSEAVMQVPAEEGETAGTVKQVVQKGYRFGEDIIRVARVIVIG